MILLADSGSTKCDWVLLDDNKDIVFKAQTLGLNPDVLTTQMLHKRIAKSAEVAHVSSRVKEVYFYGSGCGTKKNKSRLKRFLEKYFRNAKAEVHEDIMAACLATTTEPAIVCILGTGSNACHFDSEIAHTTTASLGYLVMDEGSGNYFGKQLLRDYFYKKMPVEIRKMFEKEFKLSPHEIKMNLYKQENPNAYLATFAEFMFKTNPALPYFKRLINNGLKEFIKNWVLPLHYAHELPVHFVGSIAYYSQDIIAEVLKNHRLIMGNIVQHPIDGLVNYYQQKQSPE